MNILAKANRTQLSIFKVALARFGAKPGGFDLFDEDLDIEKSLQNEGDDLSNEAE